MTRALILTGFGINCEVEMAAAYRMAGATAKIAHVNELFFGRVSIHDFDIINFPGGFSFGDDLGSGKVMANKVKYKKLKNGRTLIEEVKAFVQDGKFIFGVCNGFQMLVRMGLLPNTGLAFSQEASLVSNDSGKFEDRWVYCKVNPNNTSPFLKGLDILPLPVRHGEGKLVIKDEATRNRIKEQNMDALWYVDEQGRPTATYPANPNGSIMNIAGLTDPTGHVFGLMPHPEAFLSRYNHPNWPTQKRLNPGLDEEGLGLTIFKNIVRHINLKNEKT